MILHLKCFFFCIGIDAFNFILSRDIVRQSLVGSLGGLMLLTIESQISLALIVICDFPVKTVFKTKFYLQSKGAF